MNIKRLLAVAFLAMSMGITEAKAETLDSYVSKLAEHPQVTQILEQSFLFNELANSEMGLPDLQVIIGVDNVPINDLAFDRFLPTSKIFGFKQQIPSYSLRKAKSGKQKVLSRRQQLIADYTKKRLEAIFISQLTELDKVKTLEKLIKKQLSY